MEGSGRQYSTHWFVLACLNLRITDIFCIVREIMPQLIGQIIYLISGSEFEQQEVLHFTPAVVYDSDVFQTAGRTTAELCRKFGEKILADLVPILRTKSTSPDSRTREGVCFTLCEIM